MLGRVLGIHCKYAKHVSIQVLAIIMVIFLSSPRVFSLQLQCLEQGELWTEAATLKPLITEENI